MTRAAAPQPPARMTAPRYRRASELGAYRYCRRAWWLEHVHGLPSSNAAARRGGVAAHARLGRRVHRAIRLRRLALGLTVVAVGLIVAGLVR